MGVCTAFVFAALVEFTCVNYLWRKAIAEPYLKYDASSSIFGAMNSGGGGGGGMGCLGMGSAADGNSFHATNELHDPEKGAMLEQQQQQQEKPAVVMEMSQVKKAIKMHTLLYQNRSFVNLEKQRLQHF